MRNLTQKTAVVTGAASGLGRAIAVALAQERCHLAICDIQIDGLEKTQRILQSIGSYVTIHKVDVSEIDQMQAFSEEVIKAHRSVHILVNNAGVASGTTIENQSIEDFHRVMNINFMGVLYGCKVFLPHIKKEREGHIVNVSSVLGLVGIPFLGAYCTSKFAVRGFSESLWKELHDDNIGVTTLFPGYTKTDIVRNANIKNEVKTQSIYHTFVRSIEQRGTDPTLVAKKMVDGIKTNKQRVLTGNETFIIDHIKRVFPSATDHIIHFIYRMQNRS